MWCVLSPAAHLMCMVVMRRGTRPEGDARDSDELRPATGWDVAGAAVLVVLAFPVFVVAAVVKVFTGR